MIYIRRVFKSIDLIKIDNRASGDLRIQAVS